MTIVFALVLLDQRRRDGRASRDVDAALQTVLETAKEAMNHLAARTPLEKVQVEVQKEREDIETANLADAYALAAAQEEAPPTPRVVRTLNGAEIDLNDYDLIE